MAPDHLKELLDAVPLPLIYVAPDERVLATNAMATSLLGIDLVGRNYVTVLRQPALIECIAQALTQSVIGEIEYFTSQAGREMAFRVRVVPQPSRQGQAALVSFEDITPLQEAEQMRRDFVANVSHELRSPLTSLLGFIETLNGAAKDDPKARQHFLGIMQNEAERMNRLIHDLLSLSRVQSEERVRPNCVITVDDAVHSAKQSLRVIAEKNDVEIVVVAPDDSATVRGDADQLIQVFSNLLENAIKYGAKPGTITVTISKLDHDTLLRCSAVKIDVQDQGEGIDARHIPRLTERFYRIDNHRSRELGGTGLGLAIVKHIISRHRGHLRVTSEKGQGSCFSVVLPAS